MNLDTALSQLRWWEHKGVDLADAVCREARRVNELTIERQQSVVDNYALYGSFGAYGIGSGMLEALPEGRRLSHNALANAVDSWTSEMCQSLARPMFVTNGGSWEEQERAEQLTFWAEAEFDSCGIDEITPQCIKDGAICGMGIARPYVDGGELKAERIFPAHLLIDDRSCVDVMPRSYILRRFVDRYHLAAMFPRSRRAILDAHVGKDDAHWLADAGGSAHSSDDVLRVYEAWRLPSKRGGSDGLHTIVLGDELLHAEKYERDRPPFAFFRPMPNARGLWGYPLVERAKPLQLELNKLLKRIQDSMHHHARMIILIPEQAGVPTSKLNNDVYNVVRYAGNQPPSPFMPPSMPPDVYSQVRQYISDIYDVLGISELSAKSTIPRGMSDPSGRAIDLYNETESRRFITQKRQADAFRVQMAREMVYCQRTIAEDDPSAEVMYEEDGLPVRMKWSELDLDEQVMRIRVFPTGALSNSPSLRMKQIEGWIKAGFITPKQAMKLANIPDAKAVADMELSPEKLIEQRFTAMRRTKEYVPPSPYMDLNLAVRMAVHYLSFLEARSAPEDVLENFRRFYSEAGMLLTKAKPAPAPAVMPENFAGPMAAPEMMGAMPPPPGAPPPMPPGPMPPGPMGPMPMPMPGAPPIAA